MSEKDERRWIIGIVSDGAKSDYWKVLKTAIEEWITEEHRRLNYYKGVGIEKDSDVDKYNRAVDRLKHLQKFLTINETIANHHKSFIERVEEKVENYFEVAESFVRRIVK